MTIHDIQLLAVAMIAFWAGYNFGEYIGIRECTERLKRLNDRLKGVKEDSQ